MVSLLFINFFYINERIFPEQNGSSCLQMNVQIGYDTTYCNTNTNSILNYLGCVCIIYLSFFFRENPRLSACVCLKFTDIQ